MIDIRRDNLLQHLLFKAVFSAARSRAEYLALLFGRPLPPALAADPRAWDREPIERIIEAVDATPASRAAADSARNLIGGLVRRTGYALTPADVAKVVANHQAFIDGGLDLKFTSFGRPPRSYYPSYRQLVLERDLDGRQASFLASEEAFRWVKAMQERDLVVPVVGDLAGPRAMRAIARHMVGRGDRLSALYVSNVEFYLMREGGGDGGAFDRFARNVSELPHDERSVIIRSYFSGGPPHPQRVAGHYSTQLLQSVDGFLSAHRGGEHATYWDVVSRGQLPLR